MKLYSIKDWSTHYEVSDSKKVDGPLSWVAIRTKQDGFGFRRMAVERERCELFAAWTLMVQIAARQPRKDRGKLMRDGRPLTAKSLAMMTGFPEAVFTRALAFFSDSEQNWLAIESISTQPATSAASEQSEGAPECPANGPDGSDSIRSVPNQSVAGGATGQDRTGQDNTGSGAGAVAATPADQIPMPNALLTEAFKAKWAEYISYRRERGLPSLKPVSVAKQWEMLAEFGHDKAIESINQTIRNGWQGLFEPKKGIHANHRTSNGRSFSQQSSFAGITDK